MTTKHTPIKTPISAHLGQDYFCLYDRDDKSLFGEVMAVPEYHKRKINYIVKCVNSHEKLVEALKIAEWMISTNQEYRPFQKNTEYMDKIRQALKTAGEI